MKRFKQFLPSFFLKSVSLLTSAAVVFQSASAYAIEALRPVNLKAVSPEFILGASCNGLLPQGLVVDPVDPFRFNLLVHSPSEFVNDEALREESQSLVKYFLASVAIPGKELWVNLGPQDRDRMITPAFGATDMGKDLLIQDYWLKTLSTQATNPESETGRIFWDALYQRIYETYGSVDMPVESFQRVWIVPQSADVVVNDRSAYITDARLKVMLEGDYKAVMARSPKDDEAIPNKINSDEIASAVAGPAMTKKNDDINQIYTTVMHETVIPYLEQRVNEGEEFANLRQIYRALILAVWFKSQLKGSLFNQMYADQGRVDGIAVDNDGWKDQVFENYLANFKSGVYTVIKDSYDPERQDLVTRSYFSGGVDYMETASRMNFQTAAPVMRNLLPAYGSVHGIDTQVVTENFAMMSLPSMKKFLLGVFVTFAFLFVSQSVSAAEYSRNIDGNLVVEIEQGDQLGKIALDIKHAAGMDGNVWDKGGAYDLVLQNMIGDQDLHPGDVLLIKTSGNENLGDALDQLSPQNLDGDPNVPYGTPSLPQRLADSDLDQSMDFNPTGAGVSSSADAQWKESFESASPRIGAAVGIQAPELRSPASNRPQTFLLIAALLAATTFFGLKAWNSKRRKMAENTKAVVEVHAPIINDLDDPLAGVTIAAPAVQSFSSAVSGLPKADGSLPSSEPVLLSVEEDPLRGVAISGVPVESFSRAVNDLPAPVFVSADIPIVQPVSAVEQSVVFTDGADPLAGVAVASPPAQSMKTVLLNLVLPNDNLPVEIDLVPQRVLATRANPQSLFKADLILGVVGILLSFAHLGFNIPLMAAGAVVIPFMNRVFFTARLWTHERAHLLDALRRGMTEIDTPENRSANMTREQWLRLLKPFSFSQKILQPKIELGAIDEVTQQKLRLFGFQYSLTEAFVTIALGWAGLALLPGLGMSILTLTLVTSAVIILRASYQTDILGRTCDGQLGCGNFGFFWKPADQQGQKGFRALFPHWAQQAADDIVRQLSTRGGQSQGMTIFYKSRSGASSVTGKYVKGKRWSPNLSKGTINKLRKDIRLAMMKAVGKMDLRWFGVMGVSGHVRFTTSSRVTAPASHPHPFKEKRVMWLPVKKGSDVVLQRKEDNMVVAITHNGDNDGIYMFSNPQIENERGEYLDFDRAKAFFMKMLGVKSIATGDSPLVALQMGFLMTQGSWMASARMAHMLGMHDSLSEAEENFVRPEDWNMIANVFDRVFGALVQQDSKLAGDFTDMFDVTKQIPTQSLARLKKELMNAIEREIASQSAAGFLFSQWKRNRMDEFMNLMLEGFFRFDRYRSVQEFQKIADGSYGLIVRSSLGGDTGVTMLSLDQPLVYGFNRQRDLFAFASDHTSLLTPFGPHGNLQDLVLLKPGGRGQIADLFFDPNADLKLTTRVYDSSEKRELRDSEIRNQSYPLREGSRYYAKLVEYKDPNNKVQEDLERMPADLQKLMDTWADADSFNRRTAEAFFRKALTKYLATQARTGSSEYVKLRHKFLQEVSVAIHGTMKANFRAGVSEVFSHQMAENIANQTVFLEYAVSRMDDIILKWSEELAREESANPSLFKKDMFSKLQSLDLRLGQLSSKVIPEIADVIVQRMQSTRQDLNGTEIGFDNIEAWVKQFVDGLNDEQAPYKPLPKHTVDVVISGYSDSDLIDQNLAETLKKVFPDLNIIAIGANDLLRDQDMIGPETLVILTSKSGGQTFATGALVGILQKITPGNIFGSVGRPDSLMSVALGQKLLPNEEPIDRMFVTGNTYPAESNTVSEVLMYAQQLKMVEYLADRMNQTFAVLKPFGMTLNRNNIEFFKQQNSALVQQAEALTGVKVDGTGIQTSESKSIDAMSKRLSRKVWEPMATLIGSVSYILCSVVLAPLTGLPTAATLLTWFVSFANAGTPLVMSLVSVFHAVFYITLPWLLAVAYRGFYALPLWSRLGVQPTTISEKGYFGLMHELLLSKLGAQSWPWMTMSVYSGDGRSEIPAKFAHRIQRSGTLISAMPVYESRAAFKTTLSQSKNIMNYMWGGLRRWFPDFLLGGPEVITVGKGDFSNPNANHFHITTGEAPENIVMIIDKIENKKKVSDEELNHLMIYTFTNEEFSRFIAFKLLFGRAYIPFRKYWNIEESFPRIGVHSTRSSEVPKDSGRVHPADYFARMKKSVEAVEVSDAMLNENIAPGGIDLDPAKWMLKETYLTNPSTAEDKAMLQNIKTMPSKFIPVIIGIQPIKTEAQLSALTGFGSTFVS